MARPLFMLGEDPTVHESASKKLGQPTSHRLPLQDDFLFRIQNVASYHTSKCRFIFKAYAQLGRTTYHDASKNLTIVNFCWDVLTLSMIRRCSI